MWETFNSKEKTLHIRTNYASADFLKKLNHFRKVNAFTDVILRQENVKIPAHKIVLSCVSPYFEAMFNGNFKENQENQHEIQIGGVSDSALVSIIDYFYTGSVIVTMDNAEELLEISDILLLEETKKSILRFLKDTMNYSNCLIHKYLGSIYCDENLVESANSYFCRNFEAVSQTQQFLQIPTFEELFQLLEDCVITVKSEEIVRRGIKKWVEFDTTNRQQYLEKFTSLNIAINSITKMLIAIGYDSQDVEYLDLNDLKNGWKVLTKLPMRYGLSGASVAVYKGKILVAGGVGAGGILKAVKRLLVYDIDTNEWQVGPPMNFARKCHGSYVFQDCLYVIGGTDSRKPVMSVEKVDLTCLPLAPVKDFRKFEEPLDTTWKIMETLPSWHNGTSGVFGFGNAMAAISVYGIDHDKLFTHRSWGNFPSNNQRLSRDHPGLAKFKNGILVVGGSEDREPLDSVESFDFDLEAEGPRWNLWEQKLNIPREGPGVLQVDEETIFVVGGRGDNVDGSVEIWKDSQWTLSPSLKVKHPNQEYHCILLENQF